MVRIQKVQLAITGVVHTQQYCTFIGAFAIVFMVDLLLQYKTNGGLTNLLSEMSCSDGLNTKPVCFSDKEV